MQPTSNANDFTAQVFATRSGEDFTVLMKNYIATHYAHLLGSKVLLLNTKDGLDTLAAMVQKKLAERAAAIPATRSAQVIPLHSGTTTPIEQRRAA
jgi:hypothetical protein